MTEYLLAVHMIDGESAPAPGEAQTAFDQVAAVNTQLRDAGVWVFAGGLLPPDTATVVRTTGGVSSMTDGPFTETKEQLGGFWIICCADLDEALGWAARCSQACRRPVEVRPFADEPDN